MGVVAHCLGGFGCALLPILDPVSEIGFIHIAQNSRGGLNPNGAQTCPDEARAMRGSLKGSSRENAEWRHASFLEAGINSSIP